MKTILASVMFLCFATGNVNAADDNPTPVPTKTKQECDEIFDVLMVVDDHLQWYNTNGCPVRAYKCVSQYLALRILRRQLADEWLNANCQEHE